MLSSHLQLRQHSIGARDRDGAGLGLMVSVRDGAVINNHSPAAIAVSHTGSPAVVLGEHGLGVGHHANLGLAGDLVDLAPGVHDPGIVAGNDDHEVDAFAGELVDFGNERREMQCLAARSKRT